MKIVEEKSDLKKKSGFFSWLRSNFFAGLLVVLPIIITFYIIKFTVTMVDSAATSLFPAKYAPSNYLPVDIPGVELLLGAVLLVILGVLIRNFIGAKFVKWIEGLVTSIPGVRSVYSAVKQIIDTVSVSNSTSFREVVLIEYPRKDLWAIAFVTGETKGEIQRMKSADLVNVFLPTTPNPTSGFLLFVPRSDLKPLHMTVEQGIKLVISAGIITPSSVEGIDALQKEQRKHKGESLIVEKLTKADVKNAKDEAAKRAGISKTTKKTKASTKPKK
tara:strand:- start:207170 stop:207991 length:822 start_codon:yes stop_codon:yes gene_type:complete